jgi:hypothetical protein
MREIAMIPQRQAFRGVGTARILHPGAPGGVQVAALKTGTVTFNRCFQGFAPGSRK